MKKTTALLAAMLVTGALGSAAQAFPFGNGLQTISDSSAEIIVKAAGSNADRATFLDVGDSLYGAFVIDSIQPSGGTKKDILGAPYLTGIFETTVLSKSYLYTDPLTHSSFFNYTFGVNSNFEATYGTGAIVAMFSSTNDLQRSTGLPAQTAINNVSVGQTPFWTFGFTGTDGKALGGEGWSAFNAPENIGLFSQINPDQTAGSVNYALDLISNPNGPQLGLITQSTVPGFFQGDGSPVNITGSASLNGIKGQNTTFQAYDHLDASINVVPEPGTFVLVGAGLLGLLGLKRRRCC